jgi:cell division protein FtsZ
MSLHEVNQAAAIIKETAHPDVNLIFGAVIDPNLGDEIRVTVIATGFERTGLALPQQAARRSAVHRLSARAERAAVGAPLTSAPAQQAAGGERPAPAPQREREPQMAEVPPRQYSDDLDLPAFLRRRK